MAEMEPTGLPTGSWLYRNWRAMLTGLPEVFAHEFGLYSDGRFTGHKPEGLGPYNILNALGAPHEPGSLAPCLVLRLEGHLVDPVEIASRAFRTGKKDLDSAFTGGPVQEEFAALFALAHRARCVPGGISREFGEAEKDPRGRPLHLYKDEPVLLTRSSGTILPTLVREIPLSGELLSKYPRLAWPSARELARAARSYSLAIWDAESDPNRAWLHLVSAVETAAGEWARLKNLPSQSSFGDLLVQVKPDFANRLRAAAGEASEAVLTEVGKTLATTLRSQWKFINFLLTYGLQPPMPRTEAWPIEWSAPEMKKRLELVYQHRSAALHASVPFPLPMCAPPFATEDDTGARAWSERPAGSTYASGGLWIAEELPMNLHAFHHLAWTAITSWWRDLPEETLQTNENSMALADIPPS